MRIFIPISFLVIASLLFLPTAEPQMIQVVVAGKAAAAAPASIAFVQYKASNHGYGTTSAGPTFDSAVSTNGVVLVIFQCGDNCSGSVTDSKGNTYTERGVGGSGVIHFFTAPVTTGGSSFAITIAVSGCANCLRRAQAQEFSNASDFDKMTTAASGTSATPASAAVTPTNNGSMIVGSWNSYADPGTVTAGSGFTNLNGTYLEYQYIYVESQRQATAAPIQAGFSLSNSVYGDTYAIVIAPL